MPDSNGQLPIIIRYRAQDYETRWVPDPRVGYIKAFRDEHPDDGFVAIIPPAPRRHRHCRAWHAALIASCVWLFLRALLR